MRDRFKDFISKTIAFETGGNKTGAYTNDPKDQGKETKWGISKKANPEVNVKDLTYKQAEAIYREKYWLPAYELIKSDIIAFKLFDMAVLMGPITIGKKLQRATIKIANLKLRVDGKIGPLTVTAVNIAILEGKEKELYIDLIGRLKWRLRWIVIKNRVQGKYLRGWTSRVNWIWSESQKQQ